MRTDSSPQSPPHRLLSIDILRGFDMLWITGLKYFIIYTLVATQYIPNREAARSHTYLSQLDHVSWQGFHFYDLIFPLFLFLTGITIPLSITSKLQSGSATKTQLTIRCIRRLLLLIILGMIHQIHGLPERWPSVLGFIGLSYFIAAMLAIYTPRIIQLAYIPIALITYYLAIRFIPFNGHPAGTLTIDANLPSYIDSLIIPAKHMLIPKTPFDPEGPFMAIAGAALAMLGVYAGYILTNQNTKPIKRVGQLLILGLAAIFIAYLWSFDLPIIKQIWSSSFILAAAGCCFLLTAIFYLVIDVINFKPFNTLLFPLQLYGQNALAVYMIGPAIGITALLTSITAPILHNFSTATQLATIQALILITQTIYLYIFHKKRIFLRV
ncbi:hypothetical protein KS4_32540 [Poriferisphaera corsica]|uniref:Uncharacterized protein n=1 Tax=Poriferisphaera corsica TaxID=2528020 RepID=A0A517YY71_9BACT|nr:DUF5009 domain-containing protein [Poriferisphaera corsica]QDU35174.1 hypothetical protein KS4_32540 [Poriferisphaera corsica]